jgi:hypothetical protein
MTVLLVKEKSKVRRELKSEGIRIPYYDRETVRATNRVPQLHDSYSNSRKDTKVLHNYLSYVFLLNSIVKSNYSAELSRFVK